MPGGCICSRGVDWSKLFSKAFLAGSIDLDESGQCASRATRRVGHWLTYSLGLPGATAAQPDAANIRECLNGIDGSKWGFCALGQEKTNRRGNKDVITRATPASGPEEQHPSYARKVWFIGRMDTSTC